MIKENIEHILTNENTAQDSFENIIDKLAKPLNKVEITEQLSGDIDFAFFKDIGKGIPEEIVFTSGNITNLKNIPEGLLSLKCSQNKITTLESLPSSLYYLDLEGNYLKDMDVSNLKNLKVLNISHNNIKELVNLPESLIELKCTDNELSKLNLQNLGSLQILHISNNLITVIENYPESIIDFQMENTPSIEFRNNIENILNDKEDNVKTKQKKDYKNALNEYFKLKNSYEKKVHKLKKDAYEKAPTKKMAKQSVLSVKAPCIKCKRNVGTIFDKRDNKYIAICGDDKEPCSLNISIYTGVYMHYDDAMVDFKEQVYDNQLLLIKNKLDYIFGYNDDATSKEKSKKILEDYNLDKNIYDEVVEIHNSIFNNKQKELEMQDKNRQIYNIIDSNKQIIDDFKKTNNNELLKDMVQNNKDNLYRHARNLRNLKHEIMEMNYDEDTRLYKLYQYPVLLDKLLINLADSEEVSSFNI